MMPVVVRSTEEMLKLVPNELREASLALGVPKWRTILKVVLPTVDRRHHHRRDAGDRPYRGRDAPRSLLLVFGNPFINTNPFEGAQSSLPLYIYQQYGSAGSTRRTTVPGRRRSSLIAFVMILNLVARGIARWKAPKTGR